MKVCCIGAGYVGGPTMAVIASKCPDVRVTVVDQDADRIARWNGEQGSALPLFEPGLDELVKAARGRNLFFSTDIDAAIRLADIIFISVNTPTKQRGVGKGAAADVRNCELVARRIATASKNSHHRHKIVVEKSTVPVKTAESIEAVLRANATTCAAGGPVEFSVLSNPEFLAEGTAVLDLLQPDRVLIGGRDPRAIETLASLYAAWVPRERILTTNLWSSELSKLVANAFLAQRVSSINAVSALCEATSADVTEVARVVGADARIGPHFLQAGVGFGGSCFQKDILNLVYLCEHYGLRQVADYWRQVVLLNDYQKRRFGENIVKKMFNTVAGKKIAVFGIAFKKDTGDVRETPAADVVSMLLEEGARVAVYDPKADPEDFALELVRRRSHSMASLTHVQSALEAASEAHALVVLTDWAEFLELDYRSLYAAMAKPAFLFDGRLLLDGPGMRDIGFQFYAIGRPS
jgi:UDPglucose 6-dehydrogenase